MKNRFSKSIIVLSVFISLILVFSSCAVPDQTSSQATTTTPRAATTATTATTAATEPSASTVIPQKGDLMAGIKGAAWSATADLPDSKILKGINLFAAGLFQESAANGGNIMVSTASVFLALAMTLNGADGDTRKDMLRVLAGQGLTVEMINQASKAWISNLTATGKKTTLSIANSIWFNEGFRPDKPFLQANADYFKAGASKLDFSDEQSTEVINAWVNEGTHGLIKKIIDKINPSTVMFLINTIYFKSDWQTPFLKEETRKLTFTTPTGAIETDFMHRVDKMRYFTGSGVSGIALPYDDGQFTYFTLLPDNQVSPREWLLEQDPAELFGTIAGLMAQKTNFSVELTMPIYEVEYEDSLLNELDALGMGIAFDPGLADFSLLNEQHATGLYISEVKHKTFIRVDEKGTEAAAATSVAIDESAPVSDVQLKLDRPFIYGIMDHKTGTPLFVGILEDPAQ